MAELHITLTEPERKCVVEVLERALKETRVEEHRTRAPAYREHIAEQERCLSHVLDKLAPPSHV
ncbi:MAG TPA: hypothetical protein VFB80_23605 [Pirellulaceae bacterium]|nr:hypothetical protein [Pirellulaceae bacterium]